MKGFYVAVINGQYIENKKYVTDDLEDAEKFTKENDAYLLIDDFLDWNGISSDDDNIEYYVDYIEESKKTTRKSLKEKTNDDFYNDLANEYADEYCSSHGGNFTRDELVQAFLDGVHDKKAPKEYQCFLAWSQGQKYKSPTHKLLKESNYDLINDDLLAMCKGSTKQLIYAIDDYQSNYSDRSLKELKRKIEEVEDVCDKILYQVNKR